MDETETPVGEQGQNGKAQAPARGKDEVALDLMKFIAVTTGYGKGSATGAGFSGKPSARSPEEHAEALLELFERCRRVVNKESQES